MVERDAQEGYNVHMKAEKVILSNLIYSGKGREVFDGGLAISADRILAVGSRQEIEEKLSVAREQERKAGKIHRRDLRKYIHRMEKELIVYDHYQAQRESIGGGN